MTDSLGQSQVLPYLIELTKKGYQFSLLSFEKEEKFEKNKEVIQKLCDQNAIIWHPKKYTKNPPILSTIWDLFKMYVTTQKIHRQFPIDIIHCRSYQAADIGLKMNKKHNIPWVFDMRGFWADERIDGNIWNMSNPLFRFIYKNYKKKEIKFLANASQIISLTENAKKEMLSWQQLESTPSYFKNKPLSIEVIPCCVDTELFKEKSINLEKVAQLKTNLNITEHAFVLGYVGSIGTWYMLPEMLDFFKVLKSKKPESVFLFITNESEEKIKALAIEKGISQNDIKVTSCLHKEVPTFISLFDISIYFILPAYSKKASSPTKQGELMAMGIPIVCNANVGDADKIIADTNSGWVVSNFEEKEYEKIATKILYEPLPDQYEIIQHGIREFNLESGAKKFQTTYERILKIETVK